MRLSLNKDRAAFFILCVSDVKWIEQDVLSIERRQQEC